MLAPVTWTECTEEVYSDMLDVLPPAAMKGGSFLVGEPWDHHAMTGQPRFAAYIKRQGKFFTASRPMTRAEFLALFTSAEAAATLEGAI